MSSKGLGSIAFFMIVALFVIVSAWIFFIFFKVHVTSIAVDVDSINRYQEIPTTILGITARIASIGEAFQERKDECKGENPLTTQKIECTFLRQISVDVQKQLEENKETTYIQNCFNGDGPAGTHLPNENLCTKHLAFYFTKFVNDKGAPIFTENAADLPLGYSQESLVAQTGEWVSLKNNIKAALPICYRFSFEYNNKVDVLILRDASCDEKNFKLNEIYPIPIFADGNPTVAKQVIQIFSSITAGEGILVTWPRYNTEFNLGGS